MNFTCISNLLKFNPWKIKILDCITTLFPLNQSEAKQTNDKHYDLFEYLSLELKCIVKKEHQSAKIQKSWTQF